jgi:hypothetical protein
VDLLNKYDSDNNNEMDDEEMEALLKVSFFLDRVRQCARVCVWCVYVCVCFYFVSGAVWGKRWRVTSHVTVKMPSIMRTDE